MTTTTEQRIIPVEFEYGTANVIGVATTHRDDDIGQVNVDCDVQEIEITDEETGEQSFLSEEEFVAKYGREQFDVVYTQFWEEV